MKSDHNMNRHCERATGERGNLPTEVAVHQRDCRSRRELLRNDGLENDLSGSVEDGCESVVR